MLLALLFQNKKKVESGKRFSVYVYYGFLEWGVLGGGMLAGYLAALVNIGKRKVNCFVLSSACHFLSSCFKNYLIPSENYINTFYALC